MQSVNVPAAFFKHECLSAYEMWPGRQIEMCVACQSAPHLFARNCGMKFIHNPSIDYCRNWTGRQVASIFAVFSNVSGFMFIVYICLLSRLRYHLREDNFKVGNMRIT